MMVPALDYVGQGFEKKDFVPAAAAHERRCCQGRPLKLSRAAYRPGRWQPVRVIVLATVRGDIHDIGKNIVKVLLENYGYRVVDLGKDVPIARVVDAVKQHQAQLVGLSALMTTSVASMKETINALRAVSDCKVLVGGAVLTKEYAQGVGADAYAANAVSAVNYANEFFKK
jgi:5-methyltetrahydrofolate--homocysteine methyltransferase